MHLGSHLRHNAIAYLALFFAAAALAYALFGDEAESPQPTMGVVESEAAAWEPSASLRLYVAGSAESRHVSRALRAVTAEVVGASAYPARGVWRDEDDSRLFDERATVIEAVVPGDPSDSPDGEAVPFLREVAEEAAAEVFRHSGERAIYAVIVEEDGTTVSAEIRR